MGRYSVHSAVAIAAALLAISPCAAQAQVSSGDASATQAYLQADYATTRAEVRGFPTAIAAVDALAEQVQMECPGVLANAPKLASGAVPSATTADAAEEELDAAFGAAERTERVRRRHLASLVARLHWSSRTLTRLAHSQTAAEAEKAAIGPPSLCADMRSWVASGYQAVSAGTERYVQLESALSAKTEGAEAAILRKLVPYESPADKRIVRKLASLQKTQLLALARKFLAAVGKVSEALVGAAPASSG
jgi:hypothetical protein